jgi:DNA segregation ATPase FtsK/SpoIIIE-like protein
MRYEHKAIIDAANREGRAPSEIAKELLGHDLLKAMVTAISKPAVAFSKMTEQQQEALIDELKTELVPAVAVAIGVIVSQNTHTVRMKLKKMAVGTNYQITGQVDKTQDFIHELMDKTHDQSDVLIVLHERDYLQGFDAIKGEKDQKSLPLDGDKTDKPAKARRSGAKAAGDIADKVAPKKEIELPPTLIDQAQEFVRNAQTATTAGIQNQFKCNFDKGEAILAALELRGIVTAPDDKGNRDLVRPKPEAKAEAKQDSAEELAPELSPAELYQKVKAKVITDQEVSMGGLAVAFDLTDEQAGDMIDRLELEGVISEADDLGGREVFELPA